MSPLAKQKRSILVGLVVVSLLPLLLRPLGFEWRYVIYWCGALFFSLAHAIPGWIYGLYSISKTIEVEAESKNEWINTLVADGKPSRFWVHVYCFHHALIYFVSSLAGFSALLFAYLLISNKLAWAVEVNPSKAAVLIFLFSFAVTGISGVLAKILWQLRNLPGLGGS